LISEILLFLFDILSLQGEILWRSNRLERDVYLVVDGCVQVFLASHPENQAPGASANAAAATGVRISPSPAESPADERLPRSASSFHLEGFQESHLLNEVRAGGLLTSTFDILSIYSENILLDEQCNAVNELTRIDEVQQESRYDSEDEEVRVSSSSVRADENEDIDDEDEADDHENITSEHRNEQDANGTVSTTLAETKHQRKPKQAHQRSQSSVDSASKFEGSKQSPISTRSKHSTSQVFSHNIEDIFRTEHETSICKSSTSDQCKLACVQCTRPAKYFFPSWWFCKDHTSSRSTDHRCPSRW
jgi:hypothetical protein